MAEGILPSPARAGSTPVTQPGSGPSSLGDTFSPSGPGVGAVTEGLNNGLVNVLEAIRSEQSVPTINGGTLSVSSDQLEAIRSALSVGQETSVPNSGEANAQAEAAIRPGATNVGGSIFGLRDIDVDAGNSRSVPARGGGSILGLRDSEINQQDSGEASTRLTRGGSVFGLRDARNGVAGQNGRAALSPEAIAAINSLEQQLASETGLGMEVSILNASPRNYVRAANAANTIISSLSGSQLDALANSPTFISILRILGNADLEILIDEAGSTLETQGGNRLGVPFLTLIGGDR